jgi:competence protein ComEC
MSGDASMSEANGQGPRARGRVAALGGGRAASAWRERMADGLRDVAQWLHGALLAEADAGRLAPWLAVAFGTGTLLYFAAPSEPSIYAPAVALLVLGWIAWASRERAFAFGFALALLTVAAGFGAGTLRGALLDHSVLTRSTATITLKGFVEARDTTERSERVVLRVTAKTGYRAEQFPERVRVAFRRGVAPKVGSHVEVPARLQPLTGPVRPGGYDYARGSYFQGLGATGFALGRAKAVPTSEQVPLSLAARATVERMRRALASRIHTLLPGETGAIAAALVTGIRDAISPETSEAMRVSGLYHMLSISGLHMALVSGALFFFIRGGLALVPRLALRYPIKKWAALAALFGVSFYLVLSGAEVATQRSFIMIAIVLGGVLVDRPAISVRTLAAAAFGVLVLQPEAVLTPSFQMSFAATLALVALYERYIPLMVIPPVPGRGAFAYFTGRVLRWLVLGIATSFLAGLATAAYVAFHFHRVAPFSVLANLLAMPLISLVIMPFGLLAVLLLPFGYDIYAWKVMGAGIDGMLKVAHWVAAIPGADGRFAAFGTGALLLITLSILMLALPATLIRLAGLLPLMAGFFLAVTAPRPDALVDAEGEIAAVRMSDGRLSILDARRARFAAESWLAADGDRRKASEELAQAFTCDTRGCVGRLADGTKIAVARRREAFADDCRDAALVITRLEAPAACDTSVIDLRTLATTGAIALYRVNGRWIAEPARAPEAERAWYGREERADPGALSRLEGKSPMLRSADNDAEVEEEELDSEDAGKLLGE